MPHTCCCAAHILCKSHWCQQRVRQLQHLASHRQTSQWTGSKQLQQLQCRFTCNLWQGDSQCCECSGPAALQVGLQPGNDGQGGGGEEAGGVGSLHQRAVGAQHSIVLHHRHPGGHQLPAQLTQIVYTAHTHYSHSCTDHSCLQPHDFGTHTAHGWSVQQLLRSLVAVTTACHTRSL